MPHSMFDVTPLTWTPQRTFPFISAINTQSQVIYKSSCSLEVVVFSFGYLQLVNFTRGAQHGGGSCQFSTSYDDPEASNGWNTSATFKTIYTIIGGCPGKFSDTQEANHSNLPLAPVKDRQGRDETLPCNDDAQLDCTRHFMLSIPDLCVTLA